MAIDITHVPQIRMNLGRQRVHDSRSRSFPVSTTIDKTKWISKLIRIYDPLPNPNQCHGECTGCAKAMEMNAVGNRVKGVVFDMDMAHTFYKWATILDPFEGTWPPTDTGSSGLGAAKAAKEMGVGGEYRHIFKGADEVIQLIQEGRVVNVGTWWYDNMFSPNAKGIIEPTGPKVGGHQYIARGYDVAQDLVIIRCWWGTYRDVRITRKHFNDLLMDEGDAHIQQRIIPS